jgi:galactokinase
VIELTRENVLSVKADLAARVAAIINPAIINPTLINPTIINPTIWWWVPGRVEVFGKHTDYGGGPSLVGALPRGFLIAGRRRDDHVVRVMDSGDHSVFELNLETGATMPAEVTGWRRYVNILARRLRRDFPGAPLGADLALGSDLPRASGMSSSSALVVGVANALITLAGIDARPDFLAAITSRADLGGYFGSLENGLTFGPFPGDGGVGTFGGSEDQTAILCSRAGHLSSFTYMPVRHVADVAVPAPWIFVFASSGVAAEKAGRAQGLYNRASLGVRALMDLWRTHGGPLESLTQAITADPGVAARLDALIDAHPVDGWTAAELHTRLKHFSAEIPRVADAVAAFGRADADALGRLSAASHRDADQLLNNQLPETNALVAIARERGAFAASAFGAGFGGSVWALVDQNTLPMSAEEFGDQWLEGYRSQFPEHAAKSSCFAARPGIGLTQIT